MVYWVLPDSLLMKHLVSICMSVDLSVCLAKDVYKFQEPSHGQASASADLWEQQRRQPTRPVVRIQKDILKFQIAVDDLFAVDVVHLGDFRCLVDDFDQMDGFLGC